jgi:hypothetical protein
MLDLQSVMTLLRIVIPLYPFCLSMISAQTRSAFVARKNRCPPIGSWPEGMLFRIMLQEQDGAQAIDSGAPAAKE